VGGGGGVEGGLEQLWKVNLVLLHLLSFSRDIIGREVMNQIVKKKTLS
jgi:hypothetical protein